MCNNNSMYDSFMNALNFKNNFPKKQQQADKDPDANQYFEDKKINNIES